MDTILDLTGVWRFQPDAFDDGARLGYQSPSCDVRLWREVAIPCAFDDCLPQLHAFEGMGWFRREFDLPAEWLSQSLALRFEGVNYNAQVWVNGQPAGAHEGGFLRFELPVTPLLQPGRNVVAVRADNTRRHGQVPGKQRGWRPYGGILREVSLLARPLLRLGQPRVTARAGGDFEACVNSINETSEGQTVSIQFSLSDAQGLVLATLTSEPKAIAPGAETSFSFAGTAQSITPWSPGSPTLYTAAFTLLPASGATLHQVTVTTGFRTITTRGTQLLLNGEPIRLRGFNRHEDSWRNGMTPDLEIAERDLKHMKELGANFVRLCHYPHHPGELDLCDRLGLLAMEEIPLYWWDGDLDGDQPPAVKLAAAKAQLRELVARDSNHPATIFWSVSNETREQRPEVSAGNAQLVDFVRELDPTRLAVHVACDVAPESHFERDDVVCVNFYPSWDGRCWQSNPAYDVAESARRWDEYLDRLHTRYPDRPILVTEFGYPTLHNVFNNALGEDMQVAVLENEGRAIDRKPYVCGMTIWCYADHPWPEEPFVNYMTTSPFGIVTRDRRRKRACESVRALFGGAPRAHASDDPIDNWTVDMLRYDMLNIPVVPFPAGYGIRPLRPNEGGLWEDIWRDAEPYFPIEYGLFEKEFGDDWPAVGRRCYIITGPDGVAVGTLSSWYARDLKGKDWGRIHWVATRRAYQGRGIMRAGLSYALLQMAQWHERAVLGTSTGRIGAIKLYLDFGFVPDLDLPGAREAWLAFRQKLNHPALAMLDQ